MNFETVAHLIVELFEREGLIPVTGLCEVKIDSQWAIALNGSSDPAPWRGADVPPFHFALDYNGFPAGLFSPAGGLMAAGSIVNEAALIAALEKRLDGREHNDLPESEVLCG